MTDANATELLSDATSPQTILPQADGVITDPTNISQLDTAAEALSKSATAIDQAVNNLTQATNSLSQTTGEISTAIAKPLEGATNALTGAANNASSVTDSLEKASSAIVDTTSTLATITDSLKGTSNELAKITTILAKKAASTPPDLSSAIALMVTCAAAVAAFTQFFLENQRKRRLLLITLAERASETLLTFQAHDLPVEEQNHLAKILDTIENWAKKTKRLELRYFSSRLMFLQFLPIAIGLLLLCTNVTSVTMGVLCKDFSYLYYFTSGLLGLASLIGIISTCIAGNVVWTRVNELRTLESEGKAIDNYLLLIKAKMPAARRSPAPAADTTLDA